MDQRAFQDYYPNELSHCYGCGRLNEHGLKVKSYWGGEETVATFTGAVQTMLSVARSWKPFV